MPDLDADVFAVMRDHGLFVMDKTPGLMHKEKLPPEWQAYVDLMVLYVQVTGRLPGSPGGDPSRT
jgi:hypothetical protein